MFSASLVIFALNVLYFTPRCASPVKCDEKLKTHRPMACQVQVLDSARKASQILLFSHQVALDSTQSGKQF